VGDFICGSCVLSKVDSGFDLPHQTIGRAAERGRERQTYALHASVNRLSQVSRGDLRIITRIVGPAVSFSIVRLLPVSPSNDPGIVLAAPKSSRQIHVALLQATTDSVNQQRLHELPLVDFDFG
jgi:hypothetical protein